MSESLHTLVVIDQDINALLDVPVGLLEEKTVQLELLESHLVESVESFQLVVVLFAVQVIHLNVVELLGVLLFS